MCFLLKAAAVLAGHRRAVDLRRDHCFLAGQKPADKASGEHLALTAVVDVGGVEEGDPALDSPANDRLGIVLGKRPGPLGVLPKAHHPQTHARDT